MLVEYVRDEEGQKIGCVIAIKFIDVNIDNPSSLISSYLIGWSLCCKRDRFDKRTARHIAEGRACHPERPSSLYPHHAVVKTIERIRERAERYFKKNINNKDEWTQSQIEGKMIADRT